MPTFKCYRLFKYNVKRLQTTTIMRLRPCKKPILSVFSVSISIFSLFSVFHFYLRYHIFTVMSQSNVEMCILLFRFCCVLVFIYRLTNKKKMSCYFENGCLSRASHLLGVRTSRISSLMNHHSRQIVILKRKILSLVTVPSRLPFKAIKQK